MRVHDNVRPQPLDAFGIGHVIAESVDGWLPLITIAISPDEVAGGTFKLGQVLQVVWREYALETRLVPRQLSCMDRASKTL